jgi:hypothetical protein
MDCNVDIVRQANVHNSENSREKFESEVCLLGQGLVESAHDLKDTLCRLLMAIIHTRITLSDRRQRNSGQNVESTASQEKR